LQNASTGTFFIFAAEPSTHFAHHFQLMLMGTFLISEACEHNIPKTPSLYTLFSAAACWRS
jgi:hypothetical protein